MIAHDPVHDREAEARAEQAEAAMVELRAARKIIEDLPEMQEAKALCRIGTFYDTTEESLARNGFAPNGPRGHQGFLRKAA